jgi:hypothetical protein
MSDTLNVNVGDEVAQYTGHSGTVKIRKVVKITPTGMIVLDNGDRYRADGRHRVGGNEWEYSRLSEITDEIRAEAERQVNLAIIEAVKWRTVDSEKLAQIVAILRS